MTFRGLIAKTAPFLLGVAVASGAQARTVTIRIKSDGGRIEYFHLGKKLNDAGLEQLCAAAHKKKSEIAFQRDKMTGDDALKSILAEARCLGSGSTGTKALLRIEPETPTHVRHRHKAVTPG